MATDPMTFQIGQRVALTEMTFGFLITPVTDGDPGLTITEVGLDHVGLDDTAAGCLRRVPLYLLHHKPTPAPEEVRPAA